LTYRLIKLLLNRKPGQNRSKI